VSDLPDPTLGGLLGPLPAKAATPAPASVPDDQYSGARWEIVDAHRCTACGHLDRDGYRMVEHLRTHGPGPAQLPGHVDVPGRRLVDDAAQHDRDCP
jgi:hypothetical protein